MQTHEHTAEDFHRLVNMTAHELDVWLKTQESQAVGWVNDGDTESVGHESGRHIVRILRKKQGDYTEADRAHMVKVVGYIKRHVAQGGPNDDKASSRWAFSLKNWGHDPTKRDEHERSHRL